MSRPEQVELFGHEDGLFAPPMLECTPISELRLIANAPTVFDQECARYEVRTVPTEPELDMDDHESWGGGLPFNAPDLDTWKETQRDLDTSSAAAIRARLQVRSCGHYCAPETPGVALDPPCDQCGRPESEHRGAVRRCACGVDLSDYGPAVRECVGCQTDEDPKPDVRPRCVGCPFPITGSTTDAAGTTRRYDDTVDTCPGLRGFACAYRHEVER